MLRWLIGLAVVVSVALKLILHIMMRCGVAYWKPAIADALRKKSGSNNLPWIVATGCTGGIGGEIVKQAADKWRVNPILVVGRNAESLRELLPHLGSENRTVETLVIDFAEEGWVTKAVQDKLSSLCVGLLINCAGSFSLIPGAALKPNDVASLVRTNLRSAMLLTRLVLPKMVERKAGVILNVGSGISEVQLPGTSVYASTKVGLRVFSESLQTEVRSQNILVQCWEPALVITKSVPPEILTTEVAKRTAITPGLLVNYGMKCLTTGCAQWIFPLGYTPTCVSPHPLHAATQTFLSWVPPHLRDLMNRSSSRVA